MKNLRPFRHRHDVQLIRQPRWYLEAVVFSAVLLIAGRAVRGLLEWSSAAPVVLTLELAGGTAVVLVVTAVAHAWRGRRIPNDVRSP